MNGFVAAKLIEKYGKCPECGNDKVGNGAGKLLIEEDTLTRSCKCGWSITVNEDDKEIVKAVVKIKGKYQSLTINLREAYKEALKVKTDDDGGTANLDGIFLKLKGWREDKVLDAIKAAGLYCSGKTEWIGTGYLININCGQGNNRTRVRDKFKEILKYKGYDVLSFDMMD